MSDWYAKNIESGVRDLVRHLRDNGINTECSCEGHAAGDQPYIQCQLIPDGNLKSLHDLLFVWFIERGRKVDYEIRIIHTVEDGHSRTTLDIRMPTLP